MSEERLELVTDFASLRAGMIVVVKTCVWCGGDHRAMLMSKSGHIPGRWPDGTIIVCDGWFGVPEQPPATHGGKLRLVSQRTVADRRVFRVVDGLNPAADTKAWAFCSTAARLLAGAHR